jgi:uncharacterized membrane protein
VPTIAILAIGPCFGLFTANGKGRISDPVRCFSRTSAKREAPMAYVAAYAACALVMGGLDYLWLTNTSGPIYHRALGAVMAETPNMTAAVVFYLIYILGILFFAVRPAIAAGDWRTAALHGALFGFFAYATYDLTNLATLKVWSLKVSLIDMAWGTLLTGVAASAGALAALRLAK